MPTFIGTASSDILVGTNGMDFIYGREGDDTIDGLLGGDYMYGEDGNDTFVFSSVISTNQSLPFGLIDGGAGFDTINVSNVGPVTFRFSVTNMEMRIGTQDYVVTSVESLVFGNSSTVFSAGTYGGGLTIRTGSGNDRLTVGQNARDTIFAGGGNDLLIGELDDNLYGEAGNDTFLVSTSASGAQQGRIDGGTGTDLLRLNASGVVDLAAGTVTGSLFGVSAAITGIENVELILTGDGGSARAYGDDGANVMFVSSDFGLAGSLFLDGRGGDDILTGLGGADTILGGEGRDRLLGNGGDDRLAGGGGDDVVFGHQGNDNITGDAGSDTLYGGEGNDIIDGGSGADFIYGDAGDDRLTGGSGDDILYVGLGNDIVDGGEDTDTAVFATSVSSVGFSYENGAITVSGPNGQTVLRNVERFEFSDGSFVVGADGRVNVAPPAEVFGTESNDRLVGSAGRDNLYGRGGNDTLIGGANFDRLDGGAGIDTAGYEGLFRAYTVSRGSGGFSSVSGGREGGTDTLISIERLSFADGVLDRDQDGTAAQIYRLYDAAFDRTPEQRGLSNWVNRVDAGTSLLQAAQAFATAPEFTSRYGNLSNIEFVRQMYRFSLNREGDSLGVSAWTQRMDAGASRGEILLAFSESVEHRNVTASAISSGLFVQDDGAVAVARLYDAAFDRVPDQGGLIYWSGTLHAGNSLTGIASAFVGSQEFQDRYGALSNEQFIRQMYRFTLNREADSLGLQVWTDRLNTGTTRAEMVVIFSESNEHIILTEALWLNGIRYENYIEPSSFAAIADEKMAAHVLPGEPLDDGDGFDAADLGLSTKDIDAFVLPAEPDNGPNVDFVNLTAPTWQGDIHYEIYLEPAPAVSETSLGKEMDAFVLPALTDDGIADADLFSDSHEASPADMRQVVMIDQHLDLDAWASPLEFVTLLPGEDLTAGQRHSDWM